MKIYMKNGKSIIIDEKMSSSIADELKNPQKGDFIVFETIKGSNAHAIIAISEISHII